MTRHGKIARLPRVVREELNQRLDNGESGIRLTKWLNGLKEVKKVLRENFGGRAITADNLSEWKCGGFVEWQVRRESLEQARELSAQAKELEEATECALSDSLATVLTARYAKVLSGWDGKVTEEFNAQLRVLRSMCLDVAELRRGDHSRMRVVFENRRLYLNREKTEREVYEMFSRWAWQPAVREVLCKDWESLEEREERMEEIFRMRQEYEKELEAEEGKDERSGGVVGEEDGNKQRSGGVMGEQEKGEQQGVAQRPVIVAVDRSKSDYGERQATEGAASATPTADETGGGTAEEGVTGQADSRRPVGAPGLQESGPRQAGGPSSVAVSLTENGTNGTNRTDGDVTAATRMAGETPAPLAGDTIPVDPSKSNSGKGQDREQPGNSRLSTSVPARRIPLPAAYTGTPFGTSAGPNSPLPMASPR
jgi:hypothetical protein